MSDTELYGPRKFRNTQKMLAHSQASWQAAEDKGLIDLYVRNGTDGVLADVSDGREFVNMSSYSYLGLNRHPAVIQGAIDALEQERITGLGITPTRMQPALMNEVQEGFSQLFDAQCLVALSCTVATAALLPLVSSGVLIDGKPRVTVFDKRSHFCMDVMKPVCADESPVFTSPHNDMNFIEDMCKKYPRVAYIADGAYSMGGVANLADLLALQDRYGLFLWFDDSHSISVWGDKGEGYVKSQLGELNPLTLITGSLEKGFGCAGGIIMLGRQNVKSLINIFAGPMCWSQSMGVANLGSLRACVGIHDSPELGELQRSLQDNISYFDGRVPTGLQGSKLPVRALAVGDTALAVQLSNGLFGEGFYSAPVYYPITSRGREGLRIMIRADIDREDLTRFCDLLDKDVLPHVI
ncbi:MULTISPECIES: aminotransferase class I/II-fold pyridoxal phosphate-dependent enzyme [Streptosporangium]|uniref:8-amino-7-oxononanoate synthase n=1 Tax=Streptosporangium brasiliense TaxID=47480 RepID=A0ABT9RH41_9ACTN|nr:aminotransferase class I/II-fold pyridoxal phosphate-dependent enzyme [Streptosporangium brasiliense]MDP9867670.1 7-keto-8-aminopelargonate synthetase-like enzyme [Streptosporangium brasiliense]